MRISRRRLGRRHFLFLIILHRITIIPIHQQLVLIAIPFKQVLNTLSPQQQLILCLILILTARRYLITIVIIIQYTLGDER